MKGRDSLYKVSPNPWKKGYQWEALEDKQAGKIITEAVKKYVSKEIIEKVEAEEEYEEERINKRHKKGKKGKKRKKKDILLNPIDFTKKNNYFLCIIIILSFFKKERILSIRN